MERKMAGQYDNTNTGVLFKAKERKSERSPEYTGSVNVNGTEFWLNGWVKESTKDGSKFFSLSLREKETQQVAAKEAASYSQESDDDIPF
jgi:hypothetical protein